MEPDPEQRAITDALNRIDSYSALGRTPLAQSALIDAELARGGLTATPFQRGRLLSRMMREEVERQFEQREAQAEGRDVAEWSILYLRVHRGLSLREIADRLGMPMRSVARYYGRAKDQLLDRLYTLEEEAVAAGIYCASCGARLGRVQPETCEVRTCAVCCAELTVSSLGPDILQIVVKSSPSRKERKTVAMMVAAATTVADTLVHGIRDSARE